MGILSSLMNTDFFQKALSQSGYVKEADIIDTFITPVFVGENVASSVTYNQAQLEQLTLAISWVFSNIDLISKATAEGVLQIVRYENEQNQQIIDHPFELIFRKPNSYMGESFLMRYWGWWLQLRGEAYGLLAADGTGELKEIWPLPSDRMSPIADDNDYISGFIYKPRKFGDPVVIPKESVIYIREPNPFNYYRGLSRLGAAKTAMLTDLKAAEWNSKTFDNEAVVKTLFKLPQTLSKQNFERIKAELVDELRYNDKRYLVARSGQLDIENLGMTHSDLEYLKSREFTSEEIDRIFGIDPAYWSKVANVATKREATNKLLSYVIWPMLRLIAEEITSQILPVYYEDETLLARFKDIRPVNKADELKQETLEREVMTINEVREKQGLEPVTWGDVPYATRTSVFSIFSGTGTPASEKIPEPVPEIEEIKAEILRKWKSIASRQVKSGKSGYYDFETNLLTTDEKGLIKQALIFCEDVTTAFAVLDHKAAINNPTINDELARFRDELENNLNDSQKIKDISLASALSLYRRGSDMISKDLPSDYVEKIELSAATFTQDVSQLTDEGLQNRLDLWVVNIAGAYVLGQLQNPDNPKYMWQTGGTSKSCETCASLNGVIRTANEWSDSAVYPQAKNGSLKCGGWQCDCRLVRYE